MVAEIILLLILSISFEARIVDMEWGLYVCQWVKLH